MVSVSDIFMGVRPAQQAVHAFGDHQLTAEAAVGATLGDVVEHVHLGTFCGRKAFHPGLIHIGVAGGAAAGPATVALNAGQHGEGGGLHDGLADFAIHLVGSAAVFDESKGGHGFNSDKSGLVLKSGRQAQAPRQTPGHVPE
jgi:hypothetical protein